MMEPDNAASALLLAAAEVGDMDIVRGGHFSVAQFLAADVDIHAAGAGAHKRLEVLIASRLGQSLKYALSLCQKKAFLAIAPPRTHTNNIPTTITAHRRLYMPASEAYPDNIGTVRVHYGIAHSAWKSIPSASR